MQLKCRCPQLREEGNSPWGRNEWRKAVKGEADNDVLTWSPKKGGVIAEVREKGCQRTNA
jgi:hypothetical protein